MSPSSRPPPHAIPAGTILGGEFRLGAFLAEGSVGAVYAAERVVDGQRVAMKLLKPDYIDEDDVVIRFLEEARTVEHLRHPNIVEIYGHGRADDGTPFLVMELLDGVPLSAYTRSGARIPLGQAVPLLQGVLAGLAAAHAHGIVHRDLKPGNVFLARDGRGVYAVKILDFGIAKVMDAAGGPGGATRTGVLLGTPAYMSPEQVATPKLVDERADLWAAGVIFYRMLAGRPAFTGSNEFERLQSVLLSTPPPLGTIDPSLEILDAFMERALAKDKNARFSSAAEMARALAETMSPDGFPPESTSLSSLPSGYSEPDEPIREADVDVLPAALDVLQPAPAPIVLPAEARAAAPPAKPWMPLVALGTALLTVVVGLGVIYAVAGASLASAVDRARARARGSADSSGVLAPAVDGIDAGAAVQAATGPSPAQFSPPELEGDGDLGDVTRALVARRRAVQHCYDLALPTRKLRGEVRVRLVFGKDGRVASARLASSTLSDPDTEACIVDELRRARLESSGGGALPPSTKAVQPITFTQD